MMERKDYEAVKRIHDKHIAHLTRGIEFDLDCQICEGLGME